jgi:hypothetical protein
MQRLPHRLRAPQRQLELLPADRPPAPDVAPAWDALPDRTRQVLTGLMVRLLVAYAGGVAPTAGGDPDER